MVTIELNLTHPEETIQVEIPQGYVVTEEGLAEDSDLYYQPGGKCWVPMLPNRHETGKRSNWILVARKLTYEDGPPLIPQYFQQHHYQQWGTFN